MNNKNYVYLAIAATFVLILGGAYYSIKKPETTITPETTTETKYPEPEIKTGTQSNIKPSAQLPAKPALNYPEPTLKPTAQPSTKQLPQLRATQKFTPEAPSIP
jgi:hypothetical protein